MACSGSETVIEKVEYQAAAIDVQPIAESDELCGGAGGFKFTSGIDADNDGVLDADEIVGTPQIVCNGVTGAGEPGPAGASSSIAIDSSTPCASDSECAQKCGDNGGVHVVLSVTSSEAGSTPVTTSLDLCNGQNGETPEIHKAECQLMAAGATRQDALDALCEQDCGLVGGTKLWWGEDESGAPLADAVISIASLSEPETPCADPLATDEQGEARVDLEGGEYQLTISKDGYITNVIQLVVQPGDYDNVVFALSRELGEDDFRIVLTWDSEPSDLDAHLLGYLPDTDESFHVFWNAKSAGSLVNLDVDDTSSFGPETISIHGLPDRPLLYCVHNYTNRDSRNSTALSNSGASVYVMRHNQMLATFNASSDRTGTEWVLFWLMPDGSIRLVDEYAATSSVSTVGSAAFERGVQ